MSTAVTIRMRWAQVLALLSLIRATPAAVVGAAARQDVVEKIIVLEKQMPEAVKADRIAAMKWECSLELNRGHLGALKLGLLELWSHRDSNGGTIEQIADVAKALRIWVKHIVPALPKGAAPALVELDDETDLTDLDEAPDAG